MAHGYSLRPNSKGRRRPQSTDETKQQVEGTSTSASTSTSTVDPRPETPDTPSRAAHPPNSIITPSTISATTTSYRVERRPETWEDIQAARKRQEARSTTQAVHIHREQIRRGYEGELRALRARVVALHRECEVMVERARRESERNWAIERGEIAVVVAEEDRDGEEGNLVGPDEDREEDAEGGMAVYQNYVPSSSTTNNDEHQWPSQPSASFSKTNFRPPPPPLRRMQQQQQQDDDDERGLGETRGSRRLPRNRNHPSRPHGPHPQPLQRQRAQLVEIPTSSHDDSEMDG
ncbi:hypothetical protein V8E52_005350 [Russula decolorans]